MEIIQKDELDPTPLAFTANALTVLESRYLKKDETGKTVETPVEMFRRVATAVAAAENSYGTSDKAREKIADEFYRMMVTCRFMPNSPTLMNAGRDTGMLSACFVLPVEDSIDGIFSAIKNTAMIQKAGGGTGFSFSRLRPAGDLVGSSGGTTSGPLAFMQVFSEATNAIQQGAFRRGANMGILRIDHPDIIAFINLKQDLARLTNFNLSVALTDEFMTQMRTAPDTTHLVRNPRTGETRPLLKTDKTPWTVNELFTLIVERAWATGEPGVIFIDRINNANPTPNAGTIEATNPCGEQPLLPFESCNLGSINLHSFVAGAPGKRTMDYDQLRDTVRLAVRFLDNVIDVNRYPIPEIAAMSRGNRKIGLGVMGFADTLFALGIPYDSDDGVAFGEQVMRFINDESHAASRKLAGERGAFPNWAGSVWERQATPMRNACTTTVAPTGTVSIIANCSSGIEPLFALAFFRNVLEGKHLPEVNRQFEAVARQEGIYTAELVEQIAARGSLRDLSGIPETLRRVFVTAHDIAPEWHVRMQGAFQRHCDSSISKTINFHHDAKVEDVRTIYLSSYEHGCKGITVYRDGSRMNQPMALAAAPAPATETAHTRIIKPIALPDIMPAIRIRQITPFGNMHIKIVVDPNSDQEREVFAQLGKGGDLANSDLEAICRLVSLYLRANGSLRDILNQLQGIGSSLSIPTKDGRIASLADGLSIAIQKYLEAKETFGLEALLLGKADLRQLNLGLKAMGINTQTGDAARLQDEYKIRCPECAAQLVFEEGCTKCPACGYTKC